MVKRLFTELTRQLEKIETSSAETPLERAADARTLATLESTLERLVKLNQTRNDRRESASGAETRAKLQRKIDSLVVSGKATQTAG